MPIPTALPTPDATPPRGPTPDKPSIAELVMREQNQNDVTIGMALGSPLHPQRDWAIASSSRANTFDSIQETNVSPSSPTAAKQKQSKWKGFGGLFGRKASKSSIPTFYQLDEVQENEQSNTKDSNTTSPSSALFRGRSHKMSRKGASKRPAVAARALTAPGTQNPGGNGNGNQETPKLQLDGGPLLDVEIPNIHLDRYSVMFSGLLGKGPSESAGSLLARRQATLDKLKTVNDALAAVEKEAEAEKMPRHRRATSPVPTTKSPAFSLFPSAAAIPGTPSHPIQRSPSPIDMNRPSDNRCGLSRSNTSPAQSLAVGRGSKPRSPNRSTSHSDAESHIIMLDDGRSLLNGIPTRNATMKKTVQFHPDENILLISPQSMDSQTLPNDNLLSRNRQDANSSSNFDNYPESSDSDAEEDEDEESKIPMKPHYTEPDWQIINPPPKESEAADPFRKEIDMIDHSMTSPGVLRGRSRTLTKDSKSLAASPAPNISHSPLRSHPTSISSMTGTLKPPALPPSHAYSQPSSTSSSSLPHHVQHPPPSTFSASNSFASTSTSTSSTTTSNSPSSLENTTTTPRRARSIKEIRADVEKQRLRARSVPRHRDPEWTKSTPITPITPITNTSITSNNNKNQANPTNKNQSNPPTNTDDETERTLESAADLSIQRQISISQRQRDMLRLVQGQTQNQLGSMTRRKAGPGTGMGIDGDGMIVSIGGLGSSREIDRKLLSSGGFNGNGPVGLGGGGGNGSPESSPLMDPGPGSGGGGGENPGVGTPIGVASTSSGNRNGSGNGNGSGGGNRQNPQYIHPHPHQIRQASPIPSSQDDLHVNHNNIEQTASSTSLHREATGPAMGTSTMSSSVSSPSSSHLRTGSVYPGTGGDRSRNRNEGINMGAMGMGLGVGVGVGAVLK